MLERFRAAGGIEVDTARIYSGGETEPMLGRALQAQGSYASGFRLASKAHPSQENGLSAIGLRAQLEASLSAVGVKKFDTYYLHQPDTDHDLAESLAVVHALIQEGKIGALGLSNYSAIETERCVELCEQNGWTRPSFFQGLYNPLNRLAEDELLPVLRKYGIAFIAFNPLAAGMLTGKHIRGTETMQGRFKDNPNYLPRFYTDANFSAVENIRTACEEHGLCMVPATYAWMLRHSKLSAGLNDGLLLGASSVAQLEENLASCTSPIELPESVKNAFESAWAITREGAFPYWRSYSKDQPGKEALHPGASYNAAKTK